MKITESVAAVENVRRVSGDIELNAAAACIARSNGR
jgi:hypothetical protein